MDGLRNPTVDGVRDEGDLELSEDTITQIPLANFSKRIVSKHITYYNSLPLRKRVLLSKMQVKYTQDIIVTK